MHKMARLLPQVAAYVCSSIAICFLTQCASASRFGRSHHSNSTTAPKFIGKGRNIKYVAANSQKLLEALCPSQDWIPQDMPPIMRGMHILSVSCDGKRYPLADANVWLNECSDTCASLLSKASITKLDSFIESGMASGEPISVGSAVTYLATREKETYTFAEQQDIYKISCQPGPVEITMYSVEVAVSEGYVFSFAAKNPLSSYAVSFLPVDDIDAFGLNEKECGMKECYMRELGLHVLEVRVATKETAISVLSKLPDGSIERLNLGGHGAIGFEGALIWTKSGGDGIIASHNVRPFARNTSDQLLDVVASKLVRNGKAKVFLNACRSGIDGDEHPSLLKYVHSKLAESVEGAEVFGSMCSFAGDDLGMDVETCLPKADFIVSSTSCSLGSACVKSNAEDA